LNIEFSLLLAGNVYISTENGSEVLMGCNFMHGRSARLQGCFLDQAGLFYLWFSTFASRVKVISSLIFAPLPLPLRALLNACW